MAFHCPTLIPCTDSIISAGMVVQRQSTSILNSLESHHIGYLRCMLWLSLSHVNGNTTDLNQEEIQWTQRSDRGIISKDPPTEKSQLQLRPCLYCTPSLREGFPGSTSCLQPWLHWVWGSLACLYAGHPNCPSAEVRIWKIGDPVSKGLVWFLALPFLSWVPCWMCLTQFSI